MKFVPSALVTAKIQLHERTFRRIACEHNDVSAFSGTGIVVE